MSYTDLAAEAAEIDLADAPDLRPRSAWRILGKSQDRLDVVAKSTGRAIYAIDIRLNQGTARDKKGTTTLLVIMRPD